jgi:hypothetical protein
MLMPACAAAFKDMLQTIMLSSRRERIASQAFSIAQSSDRKVQGRTIGGKRIVAVADASRAFNRIELTGTPRNYFRSGLCLKIGLPGAKAGAPRLKPGSKRAAITY